MSDLISRKKAFEYFVTLWECIGTIMDREEWKDVCMTTANEIPSAQPKTGKWIEDLKTEKEHQLVFYKVFVCSECGEQECRTIATKFCPNCGARMR